VLVADHLVKVDRIGALGNRSEQTARLDLAKLLGIPDEDELCSGRLGVGDEPRQGGRIHHPSLVDQEDRFARQALLAFVLGAVELQEEACDARSWQALGSHHVRRPPGRRSCAQLDPGLRPALGCGDDCEGLAAARLADHHGDSLAARQQAADHLALVVLQGWASVNDAGRD
jgi:hypothetical protein